MHYALRHPPFNIHHLPSAIHHPPSTIHHPPSAFQHPPSAIRHPPSAIQHPPSNIHHLPSTIRHPPSNIQHPPSAIHHPTFNIRHPPSTIRHSTSTIHHPPFNISPFFFQKYKNASLQWRFYQNKMLRITLPLAARPNPDKKNQPELSRRLVNYSNSSRILNTLITPNRALKYYFKCVDIFCAYEKSNEPVRETVIGFTDNQDFV